MYSHNHYIFFNFSPFYQPVTSPSFCLKFYLVLYYELVPCFLWSHIFLLIFLSLLLLSHLFCGNFYFYVLNFASFFFNLIFIAFERWNFSTLICLYKNRLYYLGYSRKTRPIVCVCMWVCVWIAWVQRRYEGRTALFSETSVYNF